MIDIFKNFATVLKFENVATDNFIFRMHYKITVIMLLVFTVMVTSKQFFGEPIYCMSNDEKNPDKDAINNFCWIYGTYSLRSRYSEKDRKIIYPGVGNLNKDEEVLIKQSYYQWVCFMLLGQSLMFYIPRYMWKIWEGGRLKTLATGLASPVISKDWSEFRRSELLSYFSYTSNHTHKMYAMRYAFCEMLNLVNVIGQIFLLDAFLGGAFRNYGAAVAAFTHTPRLPADMVDFNSVNPMDKYFPKLTKCWIRTYGPSGSPQIKDRLCVLPLNVINEKIYTILWFWLMLLAFVSTLSVLFRVAVLCLKQLRTFMLMGQLRHFNRIQITRIVEHLGYGDWFILHSLGRNMNPLIYRELVNEMYKSLSEKKVLV